ncbi:diguanylate cyclase [Nodosilinea sp. P-1105]|nr:diguanylate cyclase [Nodosilinea sp. P-1105]
MNLIRTVLSSVLDSSLDGIMAFRSVRDEASNIIDFEWLLSNPAACDLVGRLLPDLIGKRLLEEMPGNKTDGLFAAYIQVVETGETFQGQFHYCHEDLDTWFETVAVKLGDGFVVTFRDITPIKQAERQQQQLNQELAASVKALQQRNRQMVLLGEMSDFLQVCATLDEAYQALATLITPLFADSVGGVFILNSSRDRIEAVATWGSPLGTELDFSPQNCWALRRGRLHQVGSSCLGLRCHHAAVASNTTLCLPLLAQGEILGLFYLSAPDIPKPTQQLARTVAEQVALALANLILRETLQHQSIRDPLTGLYNRRYLEEVLAQEIQRAQRHGHTMGVIMLDIDHFKRFNDTYGHEAGDRVLQAVGQLLRDSVRGSDLACRYGGEEMTLVLPESPPEITLERAETIRQAIGHLQVNVDGQVLEAISASFGVASFPSHGTTGADLLKVADAALYQAKAQGRNRVVVAPLLPQHGPDQKVAAAPDICQTQDIS